MDVVDEGKAAAVHRFNTQLPYKERIAAENDRLLADITTSLASFDAERNDIQQVLQACAGLERMRLLKYKFDDNSRLFLSQKLHDIAFTATGLPLSMQSGNKVMSSLATFIGNKEGQLALVGKLVLPWRPMFRALDECVPRGFPLGSGGNERSRLGALLHLIREARSYWAPGADGEIWDELKEEIAEVQTQGAFKALYLLCLFMPPRSSLYDKLLPEWFRLWGQIDHCASWDGAWITLLCQATKQSNQTFDWTPYMADIFSLARSSVHTPVSMGDAGSAPLPGTRHVAYQYQSICPGASRSSSAKIYKLGQLLVFLLGKGGLPQEVRFSDVAIVPPAEESIGDAHAEDKSGGLRTISPGAQHLLSLFRGLRTYFHPSNGGRWSIEVALVTNTVLTSLAERVGEETVLREAGRSPPTGELTRDDTGVVIEALLPLVLEMVYSKDSSVGSLSEICLSILAALSPKSVAPAIVDLVLRALDPVASINHTHQAPAAMRALTCVFRPLMHPRPYLAPYLPALLELSLPGIDANDVYKTTITLQLYHFILCWVPIQGDSVSLSTGSLDEWKPAPTPWLEADVTDEASDADQHEHLYTACEGLGGVMLEWSVAFLDRLFEVLRHKDKSSKVKAGDLASDTMNVAAAMTGLGGGGGGWASMANGGGGESYLGGLIKAVTKQLFTMMDEPAAKIASDKVLRFVTDGAVPNVEKDAAAVVQVLASARPARTVATFFPALCDGLLATGVANGDTPILAPGASPVFLRWRLQLLSGLARGGRAALAPHGPILRRLIAAGIKHNDKVVRKATRKLLRKVLHGLCSIFTADTRSLPPARWANVHSVAEWRRLCEPIPAAEQDTAWVEPSSDGLALAAELLEEFLARPMEELALEMSKDVVLKDAGVEVAVAASNTWREKLKTMDYAFRGGVCLLGDRGTPGEDDEGSGKHLRDDVYLAVGSQGLSRLLEAKDGPRLYGLVAGLRAEAARFMANALEACAQGKGPADVKAAKLAVRLSQRVACTRAVKSHQIRRQEMAVMSFKSKHRDLVACGAGDMRLQLALDAAANGDTTGIADAHRALARGGSGSIRACPRALVVARVFVQHWRRLNAAPRAIAFAAKNGGGPWGGAPDQTKHGGAWGTPWPAGSVVIERYHSLFSALMKISSSEYATVRAAAQVGVSRVGSVYPWFVREAVPTLIERLSPSGQGEPGDATGGEGGDAAHRRLTGACYLLHQRRSMRHVASTWSLFRALLLALCDSQSVLACLPADKQEKAAARVTILFTSYISRWRTNLLVTDEDKAEHDTLLNGLLERLSSFRGAPPSAGGGWRYQLMASWCLMHLVRPPGSPLGTSGPPPARPPIAVWRWFAECLSEGDGQPLQRLALGALMRLLSGADPTSSGGSEISELLCSRAFLHPLLLALAHNHKKQATEGGTASREQWSLGVKEILQDSGRGDTRHLFPRLRFATRSPLFWARNARLVSAVISAVEEKSRGGCIRILLEEATAAKAGAAHEDKRSFDCAAAEVGAGVAAVLFRKDGWGEGGEVLRETVLPFIETELDGVSLEGRLDWIDAIRFALDRSTPELSEPLVSRVVERTTAVLQGGGKGRDDYSVLVKWLSFTGAVLIELSACQASAPWAERIAKELCPLLVEGLDHPFKACREEIARNLFLVTNATDVAWATGMADDVRESILAEAASIEIDSGRDSGGGEQDVAAGIATLSVMDADDAADASETDLLASAMVMSDDASAEEEEAAATRAAKRLSLRRESVLQWLHQTTSAGDHARYLPILEALLPVALQCVRDSNVEVAAMGRGASLSSAVALTVRSPKDTSPSDDADADGVGPGPMGGIVTAVLSAASLQSSWRVRRNAAAVACVLQTRLHFVLTPAQHRAVDTTVLALLRDARREVQETARLALSTRVAHLTAAQARLLCGKFSAGADSAAASRKKRRRVAKRQAAAAAGMGATTVVAAGMATEEPTGAMREQQANVLGLSAIVLAAPCDVPPWVPGALESLAKHVNDESPGRLPVRQTVTHTFKEFRRTHQDKWEESHKSRFSRDQLDTFDDVLGGAHSYFL